MEPIETKKPVRRRRRKTAVDGKQQFAAINLPMEVRELARRYLLHLELDTGERIPMSRFTADALLEKLKRERAES